MSIFMIIAQLCSVSAGGMSIKVKDIEEVQLVCQKYYVNCMSVLNDAELKRCIIEKK